MDLSSYEVGAAYYISDQQFKQATFDVYRYAAQSMVDGISHKIAERLASVIKRDREGEDARLTVRGYFFTEPELKRFIIDIEREFLRQMHRPVTMFEEGKP